ncbi:hypothetical protein [Marinomonas sp. FW-1]|uniref:hypothetical protein n=1 Tax=Marinomonas sp. FW-1 TaxID=2071621 RepID=UPI001586E600|nr:hypothetical protein [Marinomonas sp. FW-1]
MKLLVVCVVAFLTVARSGEVRGATWGEIDFVNIILSFERKTCGVIHFSVFFAM